MSRTLATMIHASALSLVPSKSSARCRFRLCQASVRDMLTVCVEAIRSGGNKLQQQLLVVAGNGTETWLTA